MHKKIRGEISEDVLVLKPEKLSNSPKFLLGMGSAVWNMRFICSKVILVGLFFHFKVLKDEGSTAVGEGTSLVLV